jgi:aminoglycoside phosphotransferase family enzyme
LDKLAAEGRLTIEILETLARENYNLHGGAKVYPERGGHAQAGAIIANNRECLDRYGGNLFMAGDRKLLAELSHRHLERLRRHLDARAAEGFVRQCHGDLHLRNIVMIDDRPVLFDGIEFSEECSIIDIFYDFAFLVMDL